MQALRINNQISLGLESWEKKVRLIIFDKKEELACRKETFGNLKRFIESEEAHFFKGRLQLFKKSYAIAIQVKGEKLGTVSATNFKKCLSLLREE